MAKPATRFAGLAHTAPAPAPAADEPMLPIHAPQVQRSRSGKRAMTVYLPAELVKALKLLGVETERTTESLATEAMNDLLRKHGQHPAS